MAGFQILALDDTDLKAFQDGEGEIIPIVASGDGHDREGLWLTPDRRVLKYNANWNAGVVHFKPYFD